MLHTELTSPVKLGFSLMVDHDGPVHTDGQHPSCSQGGNRWKNWACRRLNCRVTAPLSPEPGVSIMEHGTYVQEARNVSVIMANHSDQKLHLKKGMQIR